MNELEWNIYATHRVAFYKDWMILEDANYPDFHLYLPDDDFDDEEVISDLDAITGYHECEWNASSLQEAIDFINSCEGDDADE